MASSTAKVTIPANPSSPLSRELRSYLFGGLLASSTIRSLQSTLTKSCSSEGWQQKVQERIFELLESGEVRDTRELERILVGEILGKDLPETKGNVSGDEGRGEGKGKENEKVKHPKIDISFPKTAKDAGTAIVRPALDDIVGNVEVEEEEPAWRDWR